jgi:hypothetical protein
MDLPDVDDMNMVEMHDHLMNHRMGEEGMNMVDVHYDPMNHRLEVEDMDMVGIHMVEVGDIDMVEERPSNHWSEVEVMDREDSDMGEDVMVKVEMVEKENKDVVLMRH